MDKNSKIMDEFIRRKSRRGIDLASRRLARSTATPEENVVPTIPTGNAGSGTQEALPKSRSLNDLLRFLIWRKKS